jgi:hypothetical protein
MWSHKMTIVHQVIGYDRVTEREVVSYDVPRACLNYVKAIAGVTSDDPDAVGSYPLTKNQALMIGRAIEQHLSDDVDRLIYFLEPYEETVCV